MLNQDLIIFPTIKTKFESEWDNMVENVFNNMFLNKSSVLYNVYKTDNGTINLELLVPGFSRDDLSITYETLNREKLIVEGVVNNTDNVNYVTKLFNIKPFKCEFFLPPYYEVSNVVLENGILKISLYQNLPEVKKPKKIEIK